MNEQRTPENQVVSNGDPVKVYRVCQVCYKPVETEKESYSCSEECADIVTAYVERDMV